MEQNTTWMSEPPEPAKDYNALSVSASSCPTAREEQLRGGVKDFLDSQLVVVFVTLLTIYALLGDDIRLLCTPKSADTYFFSAACVCLFCFTLEACLSFTFKPDYRFSFYFFLDVLSTISLLPDIGWVWDLALQVQDSGVRSQASQAKNAGSASQSATRLSRVMRIVRLVRLVRLSKLYKSANTFRDLEEESSESLVGRQLAELTTKRMITIVFSLLVLLPLLEYELYITNPTSYEHGVEVIGLFKGNLNFLEVVERYLEFHRDSDNPLIYLSVEQGEQRSYWTTEVSPEDLRLSEKFYALNGDSIAIFDLRSSTHLSAGLSIAQTFLVCVVLAIGAVSFTRDSNLLVIQPLQKVMKKLRRLAEDPLIDADPSEATADPEEYETQVIEETIQRVSALLAIGFGEAGREIIAESLSETNELHVMTQGRRISAIFGFCDIRNFTDATEVLQEGVLTFVNEVAHIVHTRVHEHLGSANKNIGDAFLVVWKYSNVMRSRETDSPAQQHLPDLALICFLKILAQVATHSSMRKYRNNAGLRQRLPGYMVRLGSGLHFGWAIEGAIGSELKIDASYLSPNVNMAARLEAATKLYGVPLLLSDSLFDHLSDTAKSACRLIDRVTLKGSALPVQLYTCDVDTALLLPMSNSLPNRAKCTQKKLKLTLKFARGIQPGMLFRKSKLIGLMRRPLPRNFFPIFREGVAQYLEGDWPRSGQTLKRALKAKPADGPSEALLRVMNENQFRAPEEWNGCRELTEK